MDNDFRNYILRESQRHRTRFIRCSGVLYEVTKFSRPTGHSPQWAIDVVRPVDVEAPVFESDEIEDA